MKYISLMIFIFCFRVEASEFWNRTGASQLGEWRFEVRFWIGDEVLEVATLSLFCRQDSLSFISQLSLALKERGLSIDESAKLGEVRTPSCIGQYLLRVGKAHQDCIESAVYVEKNRAPTEGYGFVTHIEQKKVDSLFVEQRSVEDALASRRVSVKDKLKASEERRKERETRQITTVQTVGQLLLQAVCLPGKLINSLIDILVVLLKYAGILAK